MKKIILNKENSKLIIITLITCFIVHFPILFKNILTSDILLNNFYYSYYSWEISLGRIGLYLIGLLKSFIVIQQIELFLSFIILSICSLLIINLFNIKNKIIKIIICILFGVSPSISATFLFYYCSLGYILAFFLAILSIYFLYKNNNKYLRIIMPIILEVGTLFLYQSYIQVILTLFILITIKELLDKKFNLKQFIKNIIIIGFGMILYFFFMKLTLLIFNISLSNYSGADKFGIKSILNIPNRIFNTYQVFYEYFFKNSIINNTNLYTNILNIFILINLFIVILIKSIKNKLSFKEKFICLLLIIILPIAMNFVLLLIKNTKMQLLMATNYILIIPFILSLIENFNKVFKFIFILILVLLIRNYIIEEEATYLCLEVTYNKTYVIANNINREIIKLGYNKEVMITGNLDNNKYYKNSNNSNNVSNIYKLNYGFISNSSLFWNEYDNVKNGWTKFMYQYLGVNINFVSLDKYNQILDMNEYKDMNTYPNKESIKVIDNVIVIKL